MQPRERRFQRTRQSILDSALAIIREEGPSALNMRALAERSDYSAAGLYEYFGSKDEIIAEVCEQGHERLSRAMLLADASLPVTNYLFEIGLSYIRFAVDNPDHFLLMFTTVAPDSPGAFSPETALEDNASFRILLAAIKRGIEEGVFLPRPGFERMEMAYAMWVVVHGIAMLRLTSLRRYPLGFEAADRETLQTFIRGLQSAG